MALDAFRPDPGPWDDVADGELRPYAPAPAPEPAEELGLTVGQRLRPEDLMGPPSWHLVTMHDGQPPVWRSSRNLDLLLKCLEALRSEDAHAVLFHGAMVHWSDPPEPRLKFGELSAALKSPLRLEPIPVDLPEQWSGYVGDCRMRSLHGLDEVDLA